MEDQDKPKKRKLKSRKGQRKKPHPGGRARTRNQASEQSATQDQDSNDTVSEEEPFHTEYPKASDDLFDAFQSTHKAAPQDSYSDPAYFEALVNDLHYPRFESRSLSDDERKLLIDQLVFDIDGFTKKDLSPLLHSLEAMAKETQFLQKLKKTYPQVQDLTLKKEIEFLKALEELIPQFIQGLKALDYNHPTPEFIALMKLLKKKLTFYYLHFSPTLNLIKDMKEATFTSQLDTLRHWMKKVFKIKTSQDIFIELKHTIVDYLPKSLEMLNGLENLIAGLNVLLYGKELHHQLLGEVKNGIYSSKDMLTLAHGLLEFIPAAALLPSWLDNYERHGTLERIRLLHFLNALLNVDSHKLLFDTRGGSYLLDFLLPRVETLVEHPQESMVLKMIQRGYKTRLNENHKDYEKFISHLRNQAFSQETLNEKIKMKIDDYYLGMASLKDCCQLAYDVIQNVSPDALDQHQTTVSLLHTILSLIPLPQHRLLYECLDTLIERKMQSQFTAVPDWAKPIHGVEDDSLNALDKHFNSQFEGIAQNTLSKKDTQKFIENIAQRIRAQLSYLVVELDLVSLKKATWRNQLPANQDDMAQFKLLPNLSKLLTFEKQTCAIVPDLMLYKVASPKELRQDPKEAMRLFHFFQQVQHYANLQGWTLVSHFLGQGLLHPSISAITRHHQSSSMLTDQVPVEWLKKNQMPRFSRVFSRLQGLSQHYTQTQKCFVLGRMFEKLSQVQHDIRKTYKASSPLMYNYLNKRIWMNYLPSQQPSEFSLKEWGDLDIQYNQVAKAQMFTQHELQELSAQELCDRVENALELKVSPQVITVQGEPLPTAKALEGLIEALETQLTEAMPLPRLMAVFTALDQMSQLPNFRGRFDSAVQARKLLHIWTKRIAELVKDHHLDQNQIQSLKERVESLKEAVPKSIRESSHYEAFAKDLNDLQLRIDQWLPGARHGHSRAYIKTLARYLEGQEQDQLKMPVPEKKAQATSTPMLISLDFEDIEEETDPNLIGFAQTWNVFQQVAENLVEGPPFSYENIKKTIVEAFSWAIINPNEAFLKPLNDNLLNVHPNVIALVQRQVLELVYIALDTIGKLAGPHGEFVLHNLNKIDPIISSLEFVSRIINDSETLQSPEHVAQFINLLQERTQNMKERNNTLCQALDRASKSTDTPTPKLNPNPQVNQLMSLNEKESYRHLSALLPSLEPGTILPDTTKAAVSKATPKATSSLEQTELDEWQALADEVSDFFEQSQTKEFDLSTDTSPESLADKHKPTN